MKERHIETSSIAYSLDLGIKSVSHTEQIMTEMVRLRSIDNIRDSILFLRHPRTISLGLREKKMGASKDILASNETIEKNNIPVFYSNRGGGATYYWPGQVIVYPILSLRARERDIPQYIWKLEEIGIHVLHHLRISAKRRNDSVAHHGLWIGNQKIMSVGTRTSGWITSYGFALNLFHELDINHFVRPCGINDASYITVEELLPFTPSRMNVINLIKTEIADVLGRVLTEISNPIVGGEQCQMII